MEEGASGLCIHRPTYVTEAPLVIHCDSDDVYNSSLEIQIMHALPLPVRVWFALEIKDCEDVFLLVLLTDCEG